MLIESWVTQDVKSAVKVRYLDGNVFSQDNLGNRVGVILYDGDSEAALGGTISASVIRADGATVAVTGASSGNRAWVDLPQSCYAVPGLISIVIKSTASSVTTTLAAVVATVYQSSTDTAVDPGTIIPSIADLIAQIQTAVSSIPADYSSLWTSLAPAYSTTATYAVGDYVTNGGGLYRCVTEIASGETWTAAHWQSITTGKGIAENAEIIGSRYLGEWVSGYFNLATTETSCDISSRTASASYVSLVVPCSEGDVFHINLSGAAAARVYAFLSSASGENNILVRGTSNVETKKIVAVPGSAYVVFNTRTAYTGYSVISGEKGISEIIEKGSLVYRGNVNSFYNGLIANVTIPGIYYISNSADLSDRPELESVASANLIVHDDDSTTFVIQSFFDAHGNARRRIVNRTTYTPYQISGSDANGWIKDNGNDIFEFRKIYSFTDENPGDVNDMLDPGWYGFTSSSKPYMSNLPDGVYASGSIITLPKSYASKVVTTQLCIDQRGSMWFRLFNISTSEPIGTWRQSIDNRVATKNRFAGKTFVFFGDSRTWYDGKAYNDKTKQEWTGRTCIGYQQAVVDLLGITAINQGVSGQTSQEICARIRAYDFSSVDAVFLEGGVNDFVVSGDANIGELLPIGSTFDTSTVYGAWQSAIEYIVTNYPQVKIFIDIPAIAWRRTDTIFPYTTAEIKGRVADLYNLPCLNLYKTAGITVLNRAYWYCDDVAETGWYLHFNDYGNRLLGEMMAEYINTH